MLHGEFEEALKVSDAYLSANAHNWRRDIPLHLQNFWNGVPLHNQRVLIRCYHGLGDTIQFIRYAPMVKAIASEVLVLAQPELIPLLETIECIDKLIPMFDDVPEDLYDVDVEVMELKHVFRTTLDTIPATVPYLHVEPMLPSPSKGIKKVGLMWKGGDWDNRRSIPFPLLTPLSHVPGIEWHILQANTTEAGWNETFGIHPGNLSIYDFARLVRSMDLVISIDSMPAHLAGALGVPVWTLLHTEADWRWLKGRDDSPWYPTMKLFRQQCAGEWDDVIEGVCSTLRKNMTPL